MKEILLLVTFIVFGFNVYGSDKEQILTIMAAQEKAWNNADLELFMAPYLKSEQLKFVGKNGIKYGWQTTLDNYKKTYPDKEAMGQLKFDVLEVEIKQDTAFVLGKWQLTRTKDTLSGYYTLYWKKIDGNWLITIDHSS